MEEKVEQATNLKREISLFGGFSILSGIMVGSGIFYLGSYVLMRSNMSLGLALLVWIIGGLIILLSGLCFAELGAAMPITGGSYIYLREAYGKLVAFMSGSTGFVLGSCGSIAALAIASAKMFANFIALSDSEQKILAIVIIIAFSVINYYGVKLGALVQNIFTFAKFIPIVLIILLGLSLGKQNPDLSLTNTGVTSFSDMLSTISFAVIATFWAYEGWKNLNTVAGEMKNPKRNLPLAIIISITSVMVLYVLFNFAIYRTLSIELINDSLANGQLFLGTVAANELMGDIGVKIVSITMLVAVVGATNGCLLVFPRGIFSMSEDKAFFKTFAKVHPKHKTPSNAIILTGIISILLVFSQDLDQLTTLVTFSSILFNILIFISIYIFRKNKPDMNRPYKVWGYPVTPIIVSIIMSALLINTLYTEFNTSMLGLAITLVSIVIYYVFKYLQKKGIE